MKRITISEYDKYYKEANPFECNLKDFISVNDGMVEEIKVRDRTYYLLLENYVYGLFYDKRDYEEEY